MPRRYYSSTAVETTLTNNVSNSATTLPVASTSGFPGSLPYTLILDEGTVSEEIVTVTAVASLNLTVTRGADGTTAVSHSNGATVKHGVSARDFDETNAHVNDTTTDVHPQYVTKALVNAKGDLITATANDTPAILTAGSNGQMLMADSSATAGLRYVDPPANRNLIINGAMQVAQRGTTASGITSTGYYTADRWSTIVENQGTWTQSVDADAPTGSGFRKSLKMLCTTADASPAAADRVVIRQRLEGQDVQRVKKGTSGAEQLTLSFWVKSNVTGTFAAALIDEDNTREVDAVYTVTSSATWEKKTITFPADTTGILDNDNYQSLQAQFWLGAGTDWTSGTRQTSWGAAVNSGRAVGQTNVAAATNNYWQITGVQLETGPVDTPFEFEPFEATLRKCQRYYQKSYDPTDNPGTVTGAGCLHMITQGTLSYHGMPQPRFTPTMRAAPTVTVYSQETGATGKIRNAGAGTDVNAIVADVGTNGAYIYVNNSSIASNVDLKAHWVAEIEL